MRTTYLLISCRKNCRLRLSELMPFTVAHAAAVLPFRRLKPVWSAILVGSMAPDFPYIVGSLKYRSLGHDFPGVLLFTLPASFVVLWFFHIAIKKPMAGLLPVGMQQRLSGQLGEFKFGGVRRTLAITLSIVLGIATHLVWDSFTHAYTWPWRHLVWLRSWLSCAGCRLDARLCDPAIREHWHWALCPGSVDLLVVPQYRASRGLRITAKVQVSRLACCPHVCRSCRPRDVARVAAREPVTDHSMIGTTNLAVQCHRYRGSLLGTALLLPDNHVPYNSGNRLRSA